MGMGRGTDAATTAALGAPFGLGGDGTRLAPGTSVGRYRVIAPAGEGGMGVVYRAMDPRLGRHVAVKLVHPRHVTSVAASARLLREARAVAKLNHPNVVQILDIGEHEGRVFFAMEWISGVDMRRWVRRGQRWPAIVDVLLAAARGVAAAHAEGLVHRDFKPTNVLIGNDGQVRVLDFGLARELETLRSSPGTGRRGHDLDPTLTQTGIVVGTPPYMAPEVLYGEPPSASSDLYAFCVTAWECLFGARPFAGRTVDELLAAQRAPVSPPASGRAVPRRIVRALLGGLSPDPRDRPPTIEALAQQLRPARRRRWPWSVAAIVAGGLGVGLLVPEQPPQRPCDTRAEVVSGWSTQVAAAKLPSLLEPGVAASVRRLGGAWTDAMDSACTDVALQKPQRAAAVRCLQGRRVQVERLLAALHSDDPQGTATPATVAEQLARLDGPQRCLVAAAADRTPPRPVDPTVAATVDRIRARLDHAKLQHRLGDTAGALSVARTALASAELTAFAPLLAEALLARAGLEERSHGFDDARRLYDRAFVVATEAGHDEAAIRAAIGLGSMLADHGDPDGAERWLRHAASGLDTYPAPELHVDLAHARANLAYTRSEYEQALGQFGVAIEMRARLLADRPLLPPGPRSARAAIIESVLTASEDSDDLMIGAGLHNMGLVLQGLDAPDAAVRLHARAFEVQQRALGAGHPRLWGTEDGWAMALSAAGQHEAALRRFERVAAAMADHHGPQFPDLYEPLVGQGVALLALDRPNDAIAPLSRAATLAERTYGDAHRFTAIAHKNRAQALLGANHREAPEAVRTALRTTRAAFGPDHPQTRHVEQTLAEPPAAGPNDAPADPGHPADADAG